MEKNKKEIFNDADRSYWEQPERHALSKENVNGVDFYSIFQTNPVLMIMLCDDFEYALRLAKKMIDHGVRVFDSFEELNDWYNANKT